ncbi:MAG: carbamate kinase [Acidimicrobiales bacterium]
MLIVIGFGGNALLRRGENPDPATLAARVSAAAAFVARVAERARVVVTHGNGPQVGRWAELAPTMTLDVLDAVTEGEIGYALSQALTNELRRSLPDAVVGTVLTQVVVDPADPAFHSPTKPIGPSYERDDAVTLAASQGWTIAADGTRWRRVVASPQPQEIVELAVIRALVERDIPVICAGGGGIPVTKDRNGLLRGTAAVIDKDLTTELLATELGADTLMLLTDIDAVHTNWNTPLDRAVHKASVSYLRSLRLASGSMGTKVDAACRFVEHTGHIAGIGRLEHADDVLVGRAGTLVSPGDVETRWWPPPNRTGPAAQTP